MNWVSRSAHPPCLRIQTGDTVTRALIDSYIAQRRDEGAADATIDRETELIHRALTLGQEDGLVAYVPRVTHLVKGHANAKQGFVERAAFDALLSELPSQVLRDVAAFGYCTGMRKGEILSLTWDGYDHETKTIILQAAHAKTGRGRVLRCGQSPELVAILERRLGARRLDSPLIFHNGEGRQRVSDSRDPSWPYEILAPIGARGRTRRSRCSPAPCHTFATPNTTESSVERENAVLTRVL